MELFEDSFFQSSTRNMFDDEYLTLDYEAFNQQEFDEQESKRSLHRIMDIDERRVLRKKVPLFLEKLKITRSVLEALKRQGLLKDKDVEMIMVSEIRGIILILGSYTSVWMDIVLCT